MNEKKVIFLDIDGVLNGALYVPETDRPGVLIDGTRLELIGHIVKETGAGIVLSTTWKNHWSKNDAECDDTGREIIRIFAEKGLTIFDKTPKYTRDRKREITDWLGAHPEVTGFVVIDDSPFEEDILIDHFVLTSGLRRGIDEDDAEKAIAILNGTKE